jgi:hypothetical protein
MPTLFLFGLVMWSSGAIALTSFASTGSSEEARWERGTLGVLALFGFLLTVFAGIRWWRASRRR